MRLELVSALNVAWAKGPVYRVLDSTGKQIAIGQKRYIKRKFPQLF